MRNYKTFKQSKSSQIKEYFYDDKKQELFIRFRKTAKLYKYAPITPKEYIDFEESESQGSHFHKHIKKRLVVDSIYKRP